MSLSRLLTKSRLSDARTCQRLHHMRYGLGYRPVERAGALVFGSAYGEGLDAIWASAPLPEISSDVDAYDRAKLHAMLVGYQLRWQEEDSTKYELLGCEVEFRCPLVNPETGRRSETWELGGKLDKLVRERATGDVWVVEHKSTSEDVSPGAAYWSKLRMDTQVSIYFIGAKTLGHDVRGVIYDAGLKPALKPSKIPLLDEQGIKIVTAGLGGERVRTKDGKKWRESADAAQDYVLSTRPETPEEYEQRCLAAIAEDPNSYYRRAPVVRLEKEESDALSDIWAQGQQMREAELRNRAPRNPEACSRYGSLCSYFPVCSGESTLEDQSLYRLSSNVHPELSNVEKSDRYEGQEIRKAQGD